MDTTDSGHDRARGDAYLELAPIDHEEYDALADLFLGDGGFAPESISHGSHEVSADEQGMMAPPTHETHTPVLQLAQYDDEAILREINEPGAPANQQVNRRVGLDDVLESLDVTDAHASELLRAFVERGGLDGNEDQDGDAHGAVEEGVELISLPNPTVEVVVLGHLPVRATLWARQYVCSRAKRDGETVALIRAASGSTSVDLICDGRAVEYEAVDDLESAISVVSEVADRVVIRVDESNEPELLDRAEIEEITVLTGGDEAAVVASYRLVKTLDAMLGDRYVEGEGPTIRVAVMGSGEEMARDACTKLGNAVETFIHRPIEITVGSSRIDATGTSNIFRDSMPHRAADILDLLVRSAGEDMESPSAEMNPAERTPAESSQASITQDGLGVQMPSRGIDVPIPKPIDDSRNDAGHGIGLGIGHEHDSASVRDGLSAMIPGLSTIETRCPKALHVELAVDEGGRLNLVVCDEDADDAMNQLLAARAWARNNMGLLLRAESRLSLPSVDPTEDAEAQMHLITMEPSQVRSIFDTRVRVYSLARVRFGKVIAQVATPVN